ncbi:MAG: hypothetical protein R3227_16545, partial [Reinekea sp.]|nr:hypothetical protein [Reinekea sp.]
VSDGSYLVQAPNDITITGTGRGDLLFSNGTGGFKIDGKGNIKLFGKQITLKGQSGVTFDGNVEYELGESNEPESADAIEPVEIDEIQALELKNVTADGEATQYERDQQTYQWFEKDERTRTVTVKVTSEFGEPISGVKATFVGDSGYQSEQESGEDGCIEFTEVPLFESGKVVYTDPDDTLAKSLAADIYNSITKKKQRKLVRCLQRNVDYKTVKQAFDNRYGDVNKLIETHLKHPDTQEFISLLLVDCGWLDSIDNVEVFYCE